MDHGPVIRLKFVNDRKGLFGPLLLLQDMDKHRILNQIIKIRFSWWMKNTSEGHYKQEPLSKSVWDVLYSVNTQMKKGWLGEKR